MFKVQTSLLITRALALIGVKAAGNQITDDQANTALYTLNEIADSLNADGDMIYAMQALTAPLANGITQSDGTIAYTIGPNDPANNVFNTFNVQDRPAYVSFASFQILNQGPQFQDRPIKILSAEEYQSIRIKGIQSSIGYYMYIDEQYPIANIFIWPTPNQPANLVLVSWQSLPTTLNLNSYITLPPAYARLLRYELAVNLAPEFNKTVPADVAGILGNIKRTIKWTNLKGSRLQYSREAQGTKATGCYDIYTDEVR